MATGMKRWIAATALLMALVAAWRLPPGALGIGADEMRERPEVEERFTRLSAEARATEWAIMRTLWADSLSALAVDADGGVAFAVPASIAKADAATRLERRVRDQVTALPRRADVAFGYFVQPYDQGYPDDLTPENRSRIETYAGTRDGRPYCLQVRVYSAWSEPFEDLGASTSSTTPASNDLGACRLYLHYGAPGSGVGAWLESGAAGFATETGEKPEIPEDVLRDLRRWRAWGMNVLVGPRNAPIDVDRCRAGIGEACGRLFADPTLASRSSFALTQRSVARETPALALSRFPVSLGVSADEAYLLADLEADFGPDAFQAFWSSSEPVEVAFEHAFGLDVDAWMVGWVGDMRGVMPSSPALAASASSGTLLALGLFLLLAYARNRRRTVV